jgi:hypothetical protein
MILRGWQLGGELMVLMNVGWGNEERDLMKIGTSFRKKKLKDFPRSS